MGKARRSVLIATSGVLVSAAAFLGFSVVRSQPASPNVNSWEAPQNWSDPTLLLLEKFRQSAKAGKADFRPTGLRREDYLKMIARQVDFWKGKQNAGGAIRDPYLGKEFQYSTPAFALAAATLIDSAGRNDLIDPAARAMDWATTTLSERTSADGHEDFYAPMIAHALPLLKPHVDAARASEWEDAIRRFNPHKTYRMEPGKNNWNVVALAGEARFQQMGLRKRSSTFVVNSLGAQGRLFRSPHGLYLEGPMAYDHFPRLWAADMLAGGYDGPFRDALAEVLRRGAVTSLFLQSPWGELPAGGRSAHHQWNEAEQCVTYEIYAAHAHAAGDEQLAGVYKRAAHLALSSMQRWVRPSGEMQIVKNRVDPTRRHGYEGYSSHSQYNLLPMAMLSIAYAHAAPTEKVAEKPAPADVGGYVLVIDALHKVVASVAGTYVEIDTRGDHNYDATGLIRVHVRGVSPQLGPSDSALADPKYHVSGGSPGRRTTGVGIAWRAGGGGAWRRIGELGNGTINSTDVKVVKETPERVVFEVTYSGDLNGLSRIVERYVLTRGRVELTTHVPGYKGPLRYVWPILADDGAVKSQIAVENKQTVTVTQDGGKTAQSFTTPGATRVSVEPDLYPNHNGWARLGVAEFPAGTNRATLVIAPRAR